MAFERRHICFSSRFDGAVQKQYNGEKRHTPYFMYLDLHLRDVQQQFNGVYRHPIYQWLGSYYGMQAYVRAVWVGGRKGYVRTYVRTYVCVMGRQA